MGQINAGIVHYVNSKVRKLIEAEVSSSSDDEVCDQSRTSSYRGGVGEQLLNRNDAFE